MRKYCPQTFLKVPMELKLQYYAQILIPGIRPWINKNFQKKLKGYLKLKNQHRPVIYFPVV